MRRFCEAKDCRAISVIGFMKIDKTTWREGELLHPHTYMPSNKEPARFLTWTAHSSLTKLSMSISNPPKFDIRYKMEKNYIQFNFFVSKNKKTATNTLKSVCTHSYITEGYFIVHGVYTDTYTLSLSNQCTRLCISENNRYTS